MELICTRTGCSRPQNYFADLDDSALLKTVQQKYCITCGMPLILDGRYLPTKPLGRGGFGEAFLARDRRTPGMRYCVVKQFQPPADLTPEQLKLARDLFEREGEVLEHLGVHPQIPDLYAFFEIPAPSRQPGKENQFFYLVQEFIDGQTLEQELKLKGKFSSSEVLEILGQLLPVLKYVHENNSIHRDIKPSNIMRHRNGTIYLLDFGAVKKAAAGGEAVTSSTGIYSMGFAPPEQMVRGQIYPSTDLYALAVTCLQLLTGKPPAELFDAGSNEWNWRKFADARPPLADVLDRMLLSAPLQRFQSVREVQDALAPVIPAPAIPQTPSHPTAPPSTPTVAPVNPPPPPVPLSGSKRQFSTLELLGGAAFTGFEAGLLFIALGSLLRYAGGVALRASPGISMGIWGAMLALLIFAQYRRIIAGKDLAVVAGITLAAVLFVPALHEGFTIAFVVIVPIFVAAGAIAATALFRLIYNFLSNLL